MTLTQLFKLKDQFAAPTYAECMWLTHPHHYTVSCRALQRFLIALDTVKRHVSHIFAKLGVDNRVQAMRRGQELGLLDEER